MERLDKLIAMHGYSRREAKALIRAGRVLVDGAPAHSGEQKVGEGDAVVVEGKRLRTERHLYIMLNKPTGVVCSTRDSISQTVLELLPKELRREGLFPAGRLDKDTEGFVLLTDNGDFAHRMLAPKSHVPKVYHARLARPLDEEAACAAFRSGVLLADGTHCLPAELRLLEAGPQPLAEVTLHEGMYHQVRRMFAACGNHVEGLRRVQIGGLALDPTLAPGEAREIVHKEQTLILGDFVPNCLQK